MEESNLSEPDCARFPLQASRSSLNDSISSRTGSSDSMKSLGNSMMGEVFMGLDPMRHNISDLDDDGLHGDRMKSLSSLENNCGMRSKLSMPQFSKIKVSNSPVNSKVLAAARLGRRARRKAAYCSDNKENLILAHMKGMQGTCPKHRGIKRSSAGHEGNAHFLALKRTNSASSSWQTMPCVPIITPSLSSVAATASLSSCKEVHNLTTSPQRAISSSSQSDNSLFGTLNDAEYTQSNKMVLQESTACQIGTVAAPTFACPQGSGLPSIDSGEENSSSHVDPSGKGQLSIAKGENVVGISCTKPPMYPKTKQSMPTIHNDKCSSHLVVGASCNKKAGVAGFHDQVSMNGDQHSTSKEMEMQYDKLEKGSEVLAGHERAYHIGAGSNVGDAGCLVSNYMESSAGNGICNPQMEKCKLILLDSPMQTPTDPGLSMSGGNTSDSPCPPAEKVIVLTQPLRIVSAPTVSSSGAAVKFVEVKQETSSQDSAETNLASQTIKLNSESLPRHLSVSTRDHIKDLARKQNATVLPIQMKTQNPKSHPRAWGITLHQQSQHSNVGLRRGRPPRKSKLCPYPEPKENVDKFARICAPSGVLGELNPGIITRLRNKNQVHAVLEAVVRGAFMTGMKANLKLQGAKEASGAGVYQGVHGEEKDYAAGCRERTLTKGREATSDQELDLKMGLTDQKTEAVSNLRNEDERLKHHPRRVEFDSLNGQKTLSAPFGVREEEPCLSEHAVTDVNLLKGGSLPMSQTCSGDSRMDMHELSEVHGKKVCSVEVLDYNISHAATTAENATVNVASCWLELLRLDIKGRLSALKRSRRRVRSVIVSGQLDADGKVKANQVDQVEKWRSFFVNMENVLCSEGTRLESWLNQITNMQMSYCQKKSAASDMPLLCGMDLFNVDMDGSSR